MTAPKEKEVKDPDHFEFAIGPTMQTARDLEAINKGRAKLVCHLPGLSTGKKLGF